MTQFLGRIQVNVLTFANQYMFIMFASCIIKNHTAWLSEHSKRYYINIIISSTQVNLTLFYLTFSSSVNSLGLFFLHQRESTAHIFYHLLCNILHRNNIWKEISFCSNFRIFINISIKVKVKLRRTSVLIKYIPHWNPIISLVSTSSVIYDRQTFAIIWYKLL